MDYRKEREEVVAAGRAMVDSGLVTGAWGNISMRVTGKKELLAITPSAIDYKDIRPEDIVIMDLSGVQVDGKKKPSGENPLHRMIYSQRPHITAIVHTHGVYTTAMAAARKTIPANIEDLAQIIGGSVDVCSYALPGTVDLAHNVAAVLGEKFGVLLANHGALSVGRTMAEAMTAAAIMEKGAKIHIMAQVVGGAVELSKDDVELMRNNYLSKRYPSTAE